MIKERINALAGRELMVLLTSPCSPEPSCHGWIPVSVALKIDSLLKRHVLPRREPPQNSLEVKPLLGSEHQASLSLPMTTHKRCLVAIPMGLSPV